jgi:hypothetical protein
MRRILLCGIVLLVTSIATLSAQRERQIPPPDDGGDFGTKFFSQLRSIFGKFRDDDLNRVFQLAEPIRCSELVTGKGEWREVAFFNEKRSLGDWYRESLDEVRSDLSVYIFRGSCRGEHDPIQLITKFPVSESEEAYFAGKTKLDQVDVNVNAPVTITYDTRSGAYTFGLPYLYLISQQGPEGIYSLKPKRFGDTYATNVVNTWDCKSAASRDITYRFLICRTSTMERGAYSSRNQSRSTPAYGSNAYFILSDGSEARSTVTMTFGDSNVTVPEPPPAAVPQPVADGIPGWQNPTYKSPLVGLANSEFRIRFNPDSWMNRINSPTVVSGQSLASLQAARTAEGADYCVWNPGASTMLPRLLSAEPDSDVSFSVEGNDKGAAQSTSSVTFSMKTHTGARLGSLQCFFPRTDTADAIGYDRWSAVVGGHLKLEVRAANSEINRN